MHFLFCRIGWQKLFWHWHSRLSAVGQLKQSHVFGPLCSSGLPQDLRQMLYVKKRSSLYKCYDREKTSSDFYDFMYLYDQNNILRIQSIYTFYDLIAYLSVTMISKKSKKDGLIIKSRFPYHFTVYTMIKIVWIRRRLWKCKNKKILQAIKEDTVSNKVLK